MNQWVRSLYQEKIGQHTPPAAAATPVLAPVGGERRNAGDPWPDNPPIPELPDLAIDPDAVWNDFESFGRPDDDEIEEQEALLLRQQGLFR